MEIICTIIPNARGVEVFQEVFDAGLTMIRMNFTHIDRDGAYRIVKATRSLNRLRKKDVKVLQDLRGPKLVIGEVPGGEMEVMPGTPVRFHDAGHAPARGGLRGLALPVQMDGPFSDLAGARRIAAKDASLVFEIDDDRARTDGWIDTTVRRGGVIRTEKGLNAPGMRRPEGLTDKDRDDLAFGAELGVETVCLSFVSSPAQVREAREIVGKGKHPPGVWAKIESAEGLAAAPSIVDEADGIVIGRGDLAAETSRYEVAAHQTRLTKLARKKGKTCILATGILESLRRWTNPTFAELRDIHLSVREGVDGFILTSETSIGRHPALAVEVLREAAEAARPRRRRN